MLRFKRQRVLPGEEPRSAHPRSPPMPLWLRRPLVRFASALLATGLLAIAALVSVAWLDARSASRAARAHAGLQAPAAVPVHLRVGQHRFRIPRAYFRHPPHPSGVDTGFYVRTLSAGMEPETDANRAAFQASILTAEGQRVLQIVLVPTAPGMPATDVARWMLGNAARGSSRVGRGRGEVEDFASPSAESFGLHVLRGELWPSGSHIDADLYHGALDDGRFVAIRCGRYPDPERPSFCQLKFDWRPGAWLQVSFVRVRMPEWREIGQATLALVDGWAVNVERADGAEP